MRRNISSDGFFVSIDREWRSMAEISAVNMREEEAQINRLLGEMGSKVTILPAENPHGEAPAAVEGEHAPQPAPSLPAPEETIATVVTPSVAEQIAAAVAARTGDFVSRSDLLALQQGQEATQSQIAKALELLAQRQMPVSQGNEMTAAPAHEITLLEAQDAYYLHGDRTLLQQYEAQMHGKEQARLAREQEDRRAGEIQARQQSMGVALATEYPFLNNMPGWTQAMGEYAKLTQNHALRQGFPEDTSMVVTLKGQPVDLRVLAVAAETVRARLETATAYQGRQAQDAGQQQQQARVAESPAVQGGAHQQRATPQEPTHLFPADMVSGDTALMNNPDIKRALERAGWGSTTREQLENLSKRLPEKTRMTLRQQWRQGRNDQVRQLG